MQSTKVREINEAVWEQAMKGTKSVKCEAGRVIRARTVKGQLQVKTLGSGHWYGVESVTIE
jgi:hypothetical protein